MRPGGACDVLLSSGLGAPVDKNTPQKHLPRAADYGGIEHSIIAVITPAVPLKQLAASTDTPVASTRGSAVSPCIVAASSDSTPASARVVTRERTAALHQLPPRRPIGDQRNHPVSFLLCKIMIAVTTQVASTFLPGDDDESNTNPPMPYQ